MTCVVGLVDKAKVYMGADSASSDGRDMRISAVPKIFNEGHFLIGYTSSWRMGQILEHYLQIEEVDLPKVGDDLLQFMVTIFAEKVRALFKDHGYAKLENNEESAGEFLVGFCGHLYHIESDYQVGETTYGMDACGAGEQYALGALYATKDAALTAFQRIDMALEASAEFSAMVRPPFMVKVIG